MSKILQTPQILQNNPAPPKKNRSKKSDFQPHYCYRSNVLKNSERKREQLLASPSIHINTIKPRILKCLWILTLKQKQKNTELCAKRIKKMFSMPPIHLKVSFADNSQREWNPDYPRKQYYGVNKLKTARTLPKQKLTQKCDVNHCTWWSVCPWGGELCAGPESRGALCYLEAPDPSAGVLPPAEPPH